MKAKTCLTLKTVMSIKSAEINKLVDVKDRYSYLSQRPRGSSLSGVCKPAAVGVPNGEQTKTETGRSEEQIFLKFRGVD